MADTVRDWVALVHQLYPPADAADWDTVGLQVGDPAWSVERVLVALDVTSAVVAEDGAGTSDPVMAVLGIPDAVPLDVETRDSDEVKLVTFVSPDHVDPVLDALARAGAGVIGDYERCSFRLRGTGTFRPGPGADPFAGQLGVDNEESEERLEIVVPRARLHAVLRALRASHPYEEVAFDVYPLVAGGRRGIGRVGDLPEPTPLRELADRLRQGLPAPHLRLAGDPGRSITRVAAVGGSGDGYVGAALAAGAGVLVTGDLRHHPVRNALELGLALVDAGHHATEAAAIPNWVERLRGAAADRGLSAPLVASSIDTAPWSG